MALTDGDNSSMVMPVSPMYGGGNNGFGFGGDWAWIILLLLLGWGNNGWGGNGFDGGAGGLYPWMNQTEVVNTGFRDQMINNNITSIRDGISDISTQLCNGFASRIGIVFFQEGKSGTVNIHGHGKWLILTKVIQLLKNEFLVPRLDGGDADSVCSSHIAGGTFHDIRIHPVTSHGTYARIPLQQGSECCYSSDRYASHHSGASNLRGAQ